MKSFRWWVLLGFLAYCGGARSQGPLIPVAFYAVQGAPFTATVETRVDLSNGADLPPRTQRILRDSAGRQRYEAPRIDGQPAPAKVTIFDVVAEKTIKLDMDARTAEVGPMRVNRTVVIDPTNASTGPPPSAGDGQTLLGTKEIAGLEAWGQRTLKTTTRPDGSTVTEDRELWLSTHYRMPLMQVTRSERGKTTATVISFDSAEPDPALFRIPDGFVVNDAPPPPDYVPPAPGTVRIGDDVSAPVVLKAPEAEFSEEARRKQASGKVLVYLIVNEKGVPEDVRVLRGAGLGMDEKAVEAVKKYRFKPAMRAGMPVRVEMNVEVNFQVFAKP
jgi:TonB family protein